eukprot:5000225-Pyramimonas_sp.AAC.1
MGRALSAGYRTIKIAWSKFLRCRRVRPPYSVAPSTISIHGPKLSRLRRREIAPESLSDTAPHQIRCFDDNESGELLRASA